MEEEMKIEEKEKLTFDDVLLQPQFCTIHSRRTVDTSTNITRNHKIRIPIVSANMDTVTGSDMMLALHTMGGLGILHRFLTVEDTELEIQKFLCNFKESAPLPLIAAS
ncbi:MAG: IMP dehydrogenase, partial [Nitrosopumilus sp.]